jgi:hypothetical protein
MIRMPKSRISAGLYLTLVFLSGALVGAFAHRLYITPAVSSAPRPDEWRKKYVEEVRTKVKLDEQQVVQLQQILDETRQRFHQMREQEKPIAQAIQNDQVTKIRAMLRPDQLGAYETLRVERERKRQEMDRKKAQNQR